MQMRVIETPDFQIAYKRLSPRTQRIVEMKIQQLASNDRHPALQTHRLRSAKTENIWICYISSTQRLLYQHKNGFIYLLNVGSHGIVDHARPCRFRRYA